MDCGYFQNKTNKSIKDLTWYPIYSRIPSNRKAEMIKIGTRGIISYYAKKYGKFITRDFKWDNKCVFSDTHIIYFDVSAKGYRRANRPIKMSEYTVQ